MGAQSPRDVQRFFSFVTGRGLGTRSARDDFGRKREWSFTMFVLSSVAVPIVAINGVVGNKVELPCDIRSADDDDEVSMVLWYKEGAGEPIYR